jgi:hypothetical protein
MTGLDESWLFPDSPPINEKGEVDDTSSLMETMGYYAKEAGIKAREAGEYLVNAYTGEGRSDQDLPELGIMGGNVEGGPDVFQRPGQRHPGFTPEALRLGATQMVAADPQQIANVAVQVLPGAETYKDRHGNHVIKFKGQQFHINSPGLSGADFFNFLGQIGLYSPAAKFASVGRGLWARTQRAFVAEGLTSAAGDIIADSLGSGLGPDWNRALEAALLGPAGELISPVAKRAWRAIFQDTRFVKEGELTPEGTRAAKAAGLDPEAMSQDLKETFAKVAAGEPLPEVRGRRALQEKHGIKGTTAQQSGRETDFALEEKTRHNVHGEAAQMMQKGKDVQVTEQTEEAVRGVQRKVGGQGVSTQAEAVEPTLPALEIEFKRLNDAVDTAYDAYRDMPSTGFKDSRAMQGFIKETLKELDSRGFGRNAKLFPGLNSSIAEVRKLVQPTKRLGIKTIGTRPAKATMPDEPKFLSLDKIERARRVIGKNIDATITSNPADAQAMGILKNAMDDWVFHKIDTDLFSGDPAALAQLKAGRAARKELGDKFEVRGKDDRVGKTMQRIMGSDPTPEQMANWILGTATLGGKEFSAQITDRVKTILGKDHPGFLALKEAAFLKLVGDKAGDLKSTKMMSKNIREGLGSQPSLMKTLFTPEDIATIRELQMTLDTMVIPPTATNPSRSAMTLLRASRDLIARGGTAATFSGHHLAGGGLFTVARLLGRKEFAGERFAKHSVRGVRPVGDLAPIAGAGVQATRVGLPEKKESEE